MKYSVIIIVILFINGCGLFQNNNEPDYGHCSEELFEQVKEEGSIRVIATYNMEYTPQHELNEEEREVQREKIAEMHENLLAEMVGLNISGINKLTSSPLIAMFVDEEALFSLCKNEPIKEVHESTRYSPTETHQD